MRSRLMFREHGQVIRTRSTVREVAIAVATMVAVVMLLAWGHQVDRADEDRHAFEAGLVVGREEMAETVGDAYRRGRLDALADLAAQGAQATQGAADEAVPCPVPAAPVVRRRGGLL